MDFRPIQQTNIRKHIMMLLLAHLSAMMDMLIVLVLNLYNDPQNPGFQYDSD